MAQAGSSLHLHSSLWDVKRDRALFHASNGGPHGMSLVFQHYLAGLIAAGSRVLALPRALRQLQQALPGHILRANLNRVELGQPDLRLSDHRPRGIAAGLDAIEHELEVPHEFRVDAYTTKG